MRQEPNRLVFLDETATTTKMTRLRGRARRQQRVSAIIEPLLQARAALRDQLAVVDKGLRTVVRHDPIYQRLMTVPGVGAIVALTFRVAVDQPERFRSSKSVGACFGLTPRRYQSGESDRSGAISKAATPASCVRGALFEAAHVLMTRIAAWSTLKAWAMGIARRRGAKRAKVVLASRD
jgi:transposase